MKPLKIERRTRRLAPVIATAAFLCIANPSSAGEAVGRSHFAKFGTNKVHYVVAGDGVGAIVFIHGWSCNAGFWGEQMSAFTNRARVIALDLPGHGRSDKPKTDYTVDFFANAVLAVMQDAKVGKATLVGHSMGSPIICRVHGLAPERVSALVGVDGILRRPPLTPEQTERFIAPFRLPTYREHTAQFVNAMFPNPGTEALRDRIREEMLQTPQYVMASAMDGMFSSTQPDWSLKPVAIPVCAIMTKNPMWTAEYETFVRSLSPKSDYRVIEGAGHFIAQEKPAEFNAVLGEILRKFDVIAK
jgi:pimeloyl-ACP methyl ester carboxylesterase